MWTKGHRATRGEALARWDDGTFAGWPPRCSKRRKGSVGAGPEGSDECRHSFAPFHPILLEPVAQALINKGVALGALNRLDDALVVWEDLARRFGASECQAHRELIERALIENVDLELKAGRHKAAIKMASLALDQRGTESVENRWLGHLIRARASLASGNPSVFEQYIIASLAILPELGSITSDDLDALMQFSIELGPEHMRELIQASPSATLLLPLTMALEQEIGLEPRVALEIEEVAQDIRRDLAKLKEREPMATNKDQVKNPSGPPNSLTVRCGGAATQPGSRRLHANA